MPPRWRPRPLSSRRDRRRPGAAPPLRHSSPSPWVLPSAARCRHRSRRRAWRSARAGRIRTRPGSASRCAGSRVRDPGTAASAWPECGRHGHTPIPGGMTVDAAHRSVLLRFPSAAEDIAALLRRGRVLVQAELALGYAGYEIAPDGYLCREAGRKAWTDNPPTWHVHAWALRQAWAANKTTGPTFNASVNGRRYWARYGAGDPAHDRHPDLPDSQELSFAQ